MRFHVLTAVVLASALAAACGSDEKKPPAAPTGGTQDAVAAPTATSQSQKPGDNPSQSQINISDAIRKACGISDTDAFFAFDSSNVRPQDRRVLGQLAKCFSDGPLKGRTMALVGHADPRGENEYNMVLGQQRADNVKGYIVQAGLTGKQIQTTSRGEMDATGTDEAGWAKDRRVDVDLAD